jgi:hypothetical protein
MKIIPFWNITGLSLKMLNNNELSIIRQILKVSKFKQLDNYLWAQRTENSLKKKEDISWYCPIKKALYTQIHTRYRQYLLKIMNGIM